MSTLALLGGKSIGGITPPTFPTFDRKTISKITEMLEKGDAVALGRYHPVLAEAEDAITRYHGGRSALLLNSGHAALMAAVMGLEIGQGDEVITTPYTWGASISCILHAGAVPVFVDVDRVTGLIDPARIEAAIPPRTRAILAVHLYGQPADMPAINRIARLHLPNCEHKVANSIELSTNNLVKPMRAGMKRLARCFLKVQDNLEVLRQWEREQGAGASTETRAVGAAKRTAASCARKSRKRKGRAKTATR